MPQFIIYYIHHEATSSWDIYLAKQNYAMDLICFMKITPQRVEIFEKSTMFHILVLVSTFPNVLTSLFSQLCLSLLHDKSNKKKCSQQFYTLIYFSLVEVWLKILTSLFKSKERKGKSKMSQQARKMASSLNIASNFD